jgi:hypothetical protein
MLRFDSAERRRRLAVRHALAPGSAAGDPVSAARRVVALHGTDPASVFLAAAARTRWQVTGADIEDALYQRRQLIRMLGMRRTVFVLPADLVPHVQASTTAKIATAQRVLLLKHLARFAADDAGLPADLDGWLAEVERSVLQLLAGWGGSGTATELSAAEPRLRTTLDVAAGKTYASRQHITSRVLLVLAAQGHMVRGQPSGSWLSQQYRWWLAERWLPADALPGQPVPAALARAEVARRWLAAFGPAPLADLQWWTGWTQAEARAAAGAAGAVDADLEGRPGLVLADDTASTPEPEPWVALLPALDPTVMAWSDREWYLGPHRQALFDSNGNAGPTIWAGGRVVGGWVQRRDGEIAIRLLEDIGAQATAMVEQEAARAAGWLGGIRVIPRFRTPTERELSG